MQKCNYCGYVTKYSLDKCPSCGSTQYTKLDSFSKFEVKKNPNIKYNNIVKPTCIKHILLYFVVSITLIIFCLSLLVVTINGIKSGITRENFIYLFICLTYLICIFSPLIGVKKQALMYGLLSVHFIIFCVVLYEGILLYGERIFINAIHIPILVLLALASFYCLVKLPSIIRNFYENGKYNSLKKNGILIKNLNYSIKNDTNNPSLKKLVVKYITKDNIEFELESKQSFYTIPKDNTVDLLIDNTNFNNYFIDFEIC